MSQLTSAVFIFYYAAVPIASLHIYILHIIYINMCLFSYIIIFFLSILINSEMILQVSFTIINHL